MDERATLVAVPDTGVSRSQRLRRQRILDATVALASQGGFDAVQMREVAERAGVALGTLYRYFPSKIHLLVSAMAEEMGRMRDRLVVQPLTETDPCERALHALRRVTRAMQRNRNLSDAMVRALMFGDAAVAVEVDEVSAVMVSMITFAMHGSEQPPSEAAAARTRLLGKVWLADILSWLGGRTSAEERWRELEAAARLLLEPTG